MAASPSRLTVNVRIDGLTDKLAQFNRLGDRRAVGNAFLRDASGLIAQDMVGWAQAAARSNGRQGAKFAPYIKVRKDRVPVVAVSPTGKAFKGSKVAGSSATWRVLAGAEFGGRGHGFVPYVKASGGRGGRGYWFFPTADAHSAEVSQRWNDAADQIIATVNDNRFPGAYGS